MTTSSINHRPAAFVGIAATGLVGALLTVTLSSAHAIPERDAHPAVADRTGHTSGHYVERGCFIKPPRWNEALDGPLPRCYTYIHGQVTRVARPMPDGPRHR